MSNGTAQNAQNVYQLWCKYEDIAMHFNDLLIQLRTRSLAGIAAVAALIGVFADNLNEDPLTNWVIASSIFTALSVIWISIFFLDVFYYNRLLSGSVNAILNLEKSTSTPPAKEGIDLSTTIVDEFKNRIPKGTNFGVLIFYVLVFLLILAGLLLSVWQAVTIAPAEPA